MNEGVVYAVITLAVIFLFIAGFSAGIKKKKKKTEPLRTAPRPSAPARTAVPPVKTVTPGPAPVPGRTPAPAGNARRTAQPDAGHDIRTLYTYERNRKWICRNCETENVESAVFCCVCLLQRY